MVEVKPWIKFTVAYCVFCAVALFLFSWLKPSLFAETFPLLTDPVEYLRDYRYLRLVVGIGCLVIGFGIEAVVVGWDKSSLKRLGRLDKSGFRDALICVLSLFGVWNVIGYTATLGMPYLLGGFLAKNVGFDIRFIAHVPTELGRALVTLFTLALFEYWAHRSFHTVPRLWALHKYHHASTDMTVLAAHRDNPFSGAVMGIITTIPLTFFGASLGSFVWIGVVRTILDYVIHSQITHTWGWVGRWILTSPSAHRLHHSAHAEDFGRNFGFFIIFWDRVFGTYSAKESVTKFGTKDTLYNHGSITEEIIAGLERAVMGGADPGEEPAPSSSTLLLSSSRRRRRRVTVVSSDHEKQSQTK